jgi:hypothetical protein
VLWLPVDTAAFFFFFLDSRADLSDLRKAGDTCNEEIALIKANSSWLSTTPRQEPLLARNRHSATE